MKTLFITNTYLNENSGGVFATKAYIKAFASLSESITVVYCVKDGMEPQEPFDEKINWVPVGDNRSKVRKFIDLCFGTVNRFQKNLFKYINPQDYDIVVFNNSDVSSGLIKVFKNHGVKTITIHHNYQIEYLRGDSRAITMLPNLFWTLIYEGYSVKNSDLNLTLTYEDVKLLTKHYGKGNFDVLGIFEFNPINKKVEAKHSDGHQFVITGWLGSKQTEDSLIPWIKSYYPILKEIDPEAKLTIAGRNPSLTLCDLAEANGIYIIDSPVDMQPILDAADYYICPTDRGGGLKLRNMDGLRSGLQILTHTVSARGYDYMKDLGVMYSYHDTTSFAHELKMLLANSRSKKEVQKLYNDYYSLEVGTKRLEIILRQKLRQ